MQSCLTLNQCFSIGVPRRTIVSPNFYRCAAKESMQKQSYFHQFGLHFMLRCATNVLHQNLCAASLERLRTTDLNGLAAILNPISLEKLNTLAGTLLILDPLSNAHLAAR
jgi:hypothetical protein